MHQALQIQEVLVNIFSHCHLPNAKSALPALARTCRMFKDPALDLLWRELADASPLACCLPELSHMSFLGNKHLARYAFNRSLTQGEWDILLSYTCRIVRILDFQSGLDWESVKTFLNPPISGPIFPRLHTLHCSYTEKSMHLLSRPFPALVSLNIKFENPELFHNAIDLFPTFFPNISRLSLHVYQLDATFMTTDCSYIHRWQNLQYVSCPQIALDEDALVYLSHMPRLVGLCFALGATPPVSNSTLLFSYLHLMTLHSEFLESVSQLLSRTQVPVVTSLTAFIDNCPSNRELSSFFAGILTSNAGHTIEELLLKQRLFPPGDGERSVHQGDHLLVVEDLRPCMALHKLCRLFLDIQWNVGLSDGEVSELVSAWPWLKHLQINSEWGWRSEGGITPGGLLQLLQTCPSLVRIALAIDTRDYVHLAMTTGLALPPRLSIDAIDSEIEPRSSRAISAFFCGIAICCGSRFSFRAWTNPPMTLSPHFVDYRWRWRQIRDQVDKALGRYIERDVPGPDEVD